MKRLTDRQRDVLLIVQRSIDERGFPPTLRELCRELGISSTNGSQNHISALVKKGWLKQGPVGTTRTLTVLFRVVPIIYETRRAA